jgi:hypothetical protein
MVFFSSATEIDEMIMSHVRKEPALRMWGRVRFCAPWLVLIACYFLLTGQFSATEWIASVPAALAAAVFVFMVQRVSDRRLDPQAPGLGLLGRISVALVCDSGRVAWLLWRVMFRRPQAQMGHFTQEDFSAGTDRPEDAGRRGLVILAASLAPNGFVVDLVPGALVLHRLVRVPPPDAPWP